MAGEEMMFPGVWPTVRRGVATEGAFRAPFDAMENPVSARGWLVEPKSRFRGILVYAIGSVV